MKHVLCFGDSNTWGYVPGSGDRFPLDVRWPGVLQIGLGADYRVIEEGLNGRTTVHEDPDRDGRNGSRFLAPLLESHAPLDLLILMLGSNDLMPCYASNAAGAARGAGVLLDIVAASTAGRGAAPPRTLLIAPPPLEAGDAGFGTHFRWLAEERGCAFLDAVQIVSASADDGVHLDAGAHLLLGEAVAERIRKLI